MTADRGQQDCSGPQTRYSGDDTCVAVGYLQAGDRKTAQMGQARDWWDDQKLIKEAVTEAAREAERSHAELVK